MANNYKDLSKVLINNYINVSKSLDDMDSVLALEILSATADSKKSEVASGKIVPTRKSSDVKTTSELAKFVTERYVELAGQLNEGISLVNAMDQFKIQLNSKLDEVKRHSGIIETKKEEPVIEEIKEEKEEKKEEKVADLDKMYGHGKIDDNRQSEYDSKYIKLIAMQPESIREKLLEDSTSKLKRLVEIKVEEIKKEKLEKMQDDIISL